MSVADLTINTAFRTYDPEAMSWRGEWGIVGLYRFGDVVTYTGSTYVCVEPSGIAVLAPGATPAWEPISGGGSSANNFDVSGTLTVGGNPAAGQTIIGLFETNPPSIPDILTQAGANGDSIAYHELYSVANGGHRFRREIGSDGSCQLYHQVPTAETRQLMAWDAAGTEMVFSFQNPVAGTGLVVKPIGIVAPSIQSVNGQTSGIAVNGTTVVLQIPATAITPGRPACATINVAFFDGSSLPPTTFYTNTYMVQLIATAGGNLFAYAGNQTASDATFVTQSLAGWSLSVGSIGVATVNIRITTGIDVPGSATWFCNWNWTITGGQ